MNGKVQSGARDFEPLQFGICSPVVPRPGGPVVRRQWSLLVGHSALVHCGPCRPFGRSPSVPVGRVIRAPGFRGGPMAPNMKIAKRTQVQNSDNTGHQRFVSSYPSPHHKNEPKHEGRNRGKVCFLSGRLGVNAPIQPSRESCVPSTLSPSDRLWQHHDLEELGGGGADIDGYQQRVARARDGGCPRASRWRPTGSAYTPVGKSGPGPTAQSNSGYSH
jgi:hypothetical protein